MCVRFTAANIDKVLIIFLIYWPFGPSEKSKKNAHSSLLKHKEMSPNVLFNQHHSVTQTFVIMPDQKKKKKRIENPCIWKIWTLWPLVLIYCMIAHNDTVGYIFAMWAVYKKAKEKQLISVQWHTIKVKAQMSWRSWKKKRIYIWSTLLGTIMDLGAMADTSFVL